MMDWGENTHTRNLKNQRSSPWPRLELSYQLNDNRFCLWNCCVIWCMGVIWQQRSEWTHKTAEGSPSPGESFLLTQQCLPAWAWPARDGLPFTEILSNIYERFIGSPAAEIKPISPHPPLPILHFPLTPSLRHSDQNTSLPRLIAGGEIAQYHIFSLCFKLIVPVCISIQTRFFENKAYYRDELI